MCTIVFQDDVTFLYVPPGHSRTSGVVLRETSKDLLPPGEYEVSAGLKFFNDERDKKGML